jgi:hypothetical protein
MARCVAGSTMRWGTTCGAIIPNTTSGSATTSLTSLTTPGLTREEVFRRFVEAQRRLRRVIEDHPDILNFAPFSVSLGSFL